MVCESYSTPTIVGGRGDEEMEAVFVQYMEVAARLIAVKKKLSCVYVR